MANHRRNSNQSGAPRNSLPTIPESRRSDVGGLDIKDLTNRFEQLLSARRMTELSERARQRRKSQSSLRTPERGTTLVPPAYSTLRNLPKVATKPQDAASIRFRAQLMAVSVTPLKYENPGLLDEALAVIPLERIYSEADEEAQLLQAQAASISERARPTWGYQDCVIRSLLR